MNNALCVCVGLDSPLENQAYSNNPMGRFNPVLPRQMQDRLEDLGVVQEEAVRSSQSVDLQKQRVRNVVTVSVPALNRRVSLTVDVKFQPNDRDKRRIDVKFDSCRLLVPTSPLDITIPLGLFGPTGWLRTTYIDDTIRITRGHKGSVFVLLRTSRKKT
jgi:PAP_fibrillin